MEIIKKLHLMEEKIKKISFVRNIRRKQLNQFSDLSRYAARRKCVLLSYKLTLIKTYRVD